MSNGSPKVKTFWAPPSLFFGSGLAANGETGVADGFHLRVFPSHLIGFPHMPFVGQEIPPVIVASQMRPMSMADFSVSNNIDPNTGDIKFSTFGDSISGCTIEFATKILALLGPTRVAIHHTPRRRIVVDRS